ncbi:Uncharacterized protein APZ42_025375 [Daphnia magna]|uniref:Uncharacterized protein n=1 Tax=Daphnia magna TaxID=35525 RepID=A0A164T5N9_9CRUS|nr:Uncharacterized protein APZ42_025375 [Daphnia magna]
MPSKVLPGAVTVCGAQYIGNRAHPKFVRWLGKLPTTQHQN